MRQIPPHELAWTAGFFEGEGSIGIRRPTPRNRGTLIATVVNTDREAIEWFNERWPAFFKTMKKTPGRKQAWRWIAAANVAAGFLRAIQPFVVRAHVHRRIAIALMFQDQKSRKASINRTREYRVWQEAFFDEMADMNRRGDP